MMGVINVGKVDEDRDARDGFDKVRTLLTGEKALEGWRSFGVTLGLSTLGLFWPLAAVLALVSSRFVFGDRGMPSLYGVGVGCLVCLLGAL